MRYHFSVYLRKYKNESAGNTCTSIFIEYIQENGACLYANLNQVCNVW